MAWMTNPTLKPSEWISSTNLVCKDPADSLRACCYDSYEAGSLGPSLATNADVTCEATEDAVAART